MSGVRIKAEGHQIERAAAHHNAMHSRSSAGQIQATDVIEQFGLDFADPPSSCSSNRIHNSSLERA